MRGIASPKGTLVLAGMALFGAYVGGRANSTRGMLSFLVVTGLLLAVSLVDLEVQRIPNALTLALAAWAVVQVLWLGSPEPVRAVFGFLVGGGLFALIALAGRGAMGMGDVKLAAAMGMVVGYPLVVRSLLLGILVGGLGALWSLASRRAGHDRYMAYGPYLALGMWAAWIGAMGLWP